MKMEILKIGKWNGLDITRKIMDEMVANFRHFKEILQVPLKFGHNEKQKMTDGQPSLGMLADIWINESGTMMAEAVDMPEIVKNAIEKKLYKTVSIEASLEVNHKGKDYGAVLTGLALLGADLPAVNTLKDLQTYMTAQNDSDFTFSRCANFTAIGGTQTKIEDKTMTEEEMKAAIAKAEAATAVANSEAAKFKAENETANAVLKSENEKLKEGQAEVKFTADKKIVVDEMEAMVKSNQLTPGQRDKFIAQITDDDSLASVKMSVDILTEGKKTLATGEQGEVKTDTDKENEGKRPDEILHAKATAFSATNKVSYSQAIDSVMLSDPKLAADYTKQFDEEAA